jgi:hypothetical protein
MGQGVGDETGLKVSQFYPDDFLINKRDRERERQRERERNYPNNFFFSVLGFEFRASCMLSKLCTS